MGTPNRLDDLLNPTKVDLSDLTPGDRVGLFRALLVEITPHLKYMPLESVRDELAFPVLSTAEWERARRLFLSHGGDTKVLVLQRTDEWRGEGYNIAGLGFTQEYRHFIRFLLTRNGAFIAMRVTQKFLFGEADSDDSTRRTLQNVVFRVQFLHPMAYSEERIERFFTADRLRGMLSSVERSLGQYVEFRQELLSDAEQIRTRYEQLNERIS
jgi:hypothetical protein